MKEQNEKQDRVNQQALGPIALLLKLYLTVQTVQLQRILTGWRISSLYIY